MLARNRLLQQLNVAEPNRLWGTDIRYIRTYEGCPYLAVALDLFSRQVIGWSTKSTIDLELLLDALSMAVWRRQPKHKATVHSDQGSQYGSHVWQAANSGWSHLMGWAEP